MPITHVRNNVFETNSSTMNQIVICKNVLNNTTRILQEIKEIKEKGLIVDGFIQDKPDYKGMYTSLKDKINILYGSIYEIELYEDNINTIDLAKMKDNIKEVLEDMSIYKYLTFKKFNEPDVAYIGMSGSSYFIYFAKDKYNIFRFLVSDDSIYTIGEENAWPFHTVGYTDEELDRNIFEEFIV